MTRSQSSALWCGRQAGLSPEVEGLLLDAVADGFVVHCCGPRTAPNALVASYQWDHYLDLLTVRDFDRVTVARVPTRDRVDIFAPEVVVWAYEGPPSTHCQLCSTWCTQHTPTPPPLSTRRHRACTSPAPSNAR